MSETIDGQATTTALTLPDKSMLQRELQAVRQFQALAQSELIKDHDFGVIPGTNKPTLLKPGAEKIAKLLGLVDTYEVMREIEDFERPFFAYTIRCRLKKFGTEFVVSEGLGECNSYESKYRYRWLWGRDASEDIKRTAPTRTINTRNGRTTQYRVENDDIFSQVNTLLKMAKKRALVDAALSAGRLSDVFTQDMDEIESTGDAVIDGEAREVPSEPASQDAPSASRTRSAAPTKVTATADPAWQHWAALCAEAEQLKVPVPQLALPIATEDLRTAYGALQATVRVKRSEQAEDAAIDADFVEATDSAPADQNDIKDLDAEAARKGVGDFVDAARAVGIDIDHDPTRGEVERVRSWLAEQPEPAGASKK